MSKVILGSALIRRRPSNGTMAGAALWSSPIRWERENYRTFNSATGARCYARIAITRLPLSLQNKKPVPSVAQDGSFLPLPCRHGLPAMVVITAEVRDVAVVPAHMGIDKRRGVHDARAVNDRRRAIHGRRRAVGGCGRVIHRRRCRTIGGLGRHVNGLGAPLRLRPRPPGTRRRTQTAAEEAERPRWPAECSSRPGPGLAAAVIIIFFILGLSLSFSNPLQV